MENLAKLADHLITEADKMALKVLQDPAKHLKELDIIVKLCDAHSGICESLEIEEKFDEEHHDHYHDGTSMFAGTPRRRW